MKIPIISKLWNRRPDSKNSLIGSSYSFLFGVTPTGKTINEKTAMQTTAVYSCVRIAAETLVSLPFHTFKYTESGNEKAIEHLIYHLLADELNLEMTSFVFRETLMGHFLLWKNSLRKFQLNEIARIFRIPPHMISDLDKSSFLI